jgi:putative lipoprotein
MPAAQNFKYVCDDGTTIRVQLRENLARVIFKGKSYSMKQVESGSGARYSDGTTVWWNRGYEGFLRDESDPDHPVALAENCRQVSPAPSGAFANNTATVSGTVGYRERIAMPENAILTVELQDIPRPGAPAQIIAEEKLMLGGRQVPLPFELTYKPSHIHPDHTYAVSARITVNGHLRFQNATTYPVITLGNPNKVDLLLQAVETQSR